MTALLEETVVFAHHKRITHEELWTRRTESILSEIVYQIPSIDGEAVARALDFLTWGHCRATYEEHKVNDDGGPGAEFRFSYQSHMSIILPEKHAECWYGSDFGGETALWCQNCGAAKIHGTLTRRIRLGL